MEGIDPEMLERLRRGFGLRMSPTGTLRFDDGPVTHPRIERLLRRGLDVTEAGEPIVRMGPQWAYVTVEDCALRAIGIEPGSDTLTLVLDDGRRLPLDPHTLWEEPGRGLRCTVPSAASGRPLSVRFTNRAQMQLADFIEDTTPAPTLRVAGRRFSISDRPPPSSAPRRGG